MALCRSYQFGRCLRGSACKNDHFDIKNCMKIEVDEAINGKQWPLSTFGPFPYKPSIPSFIEDQSFEEVRMSFYEAKLKNFFGQSHQQFNRDVLEAQNKMKSLLQMGTDTLFVLINIHETPSNMNINAADQSVSNIFAVNATNRRSKIQPKRNKNHPFIQSIKPSKPIFGNESNSETKKSSTLKIFNSSSQETLSTFGNSPALTLQQDINKGNSIILDQASNPFKSIFVNRNNTSTQVCDYQKKNNEKEKQLASDGLFVTDHISKKIDKSIMDFILVDMLPYSVVEGVAFQRIQFADPSAKNRYIKKTENFFRTSLMPKTFNKINEKVVATMETAKWVSFTIDISKFPNSLSYLLGFTAHFIVGTTRKKMVLGANILESDQKDKYITEKLSEIITNFKLKEKMHIFVCDLAQNVEASIKIGNLKSLECVPDIIELTIQNVVFKEKNIKEIITKCRKIVEYFEKSEDRSEILQTIREKCSLSKKALVQDVDKKWSSTYLMIEAFIEQKSAINLYSVENLNPEEWKTLNDIVDVLESFYEASIELYADDTSLSLVLPLIALLTSKLDEDGDAAAPLKKQLKQDLDERFNLLKKSPFLITATLLDPRFKHKYLNETQIQIAEKEISDFLDESKSTKASESTVESSKGTITKRCKTLKNSLWEKHDSMPFSMETIQNDHCSFKRELSLYMREPLKPRQSNIYEFWHRSLDENLKKVAIKYLSAPPTTKNEKFFSAAERLYTNGVANLQKVDIEKFLFCHYNIQLFDFDY